MAQDIPSQGDLRVVKEPREWEQTAMKKRPWRIELFELITRRLSSHAQGQARVLELGAGPGFLAYYVLNSLPTLPHYVLLDGSPENHSLASERLGSLRSRASFLERDFKQPGWTGGLGPFDAVVSMQAVQEHRHKSHAQELHAQVRRVLAPQGLYLVCDHYCGPGGMSNEALYMSPDEQEQSLRDAGFGQIDLITQLSGLTLFAAR
jgi:SAM-dependent methyltransferase